MRRIIAKVITKVISQEWGNLLVFKEHVTDLDNGQITEESELSSIQNVVNGTDTIDTVWYCHPRAKEVFARYHLNSCNKCSVRFDETIQEAALAYDFSEEAMLDEINALFRETV
jgi:hypothetical protein